MPDDLTTRCLAEVERALEGTVVQDATLLKLRLARMLAANGHAYESAIRALYMDDRVAKSVRQAALRAVAQAREIP